MIDVIDRVPGLALTHAVLRQEMQDARLRARAYTRAHGEDAPEIAGWTWNSAPTPNGGDRGIPAPSVEPEHHDQKE